MFIVWGTREMRKVLAYTQVYTCPQCGNVHPFEVVRKGTWFTLFWIPIFPFSIKYYMECPICKVSNQMDAGEAKMLQQQQKNLQG